MQQRKPETWAKWRGLISEHRNSGQNIAAFCRKRGVPTSQFFAWRKRLSRAPAPPFVEVQVVEKMPRQQTAPGQAIEVHLDGGRRLFVAPGFDAAHLRAVVSALEPRV